MERRVRSHTFRGRRWRVVEARRAASWGSCDPPHVADKALLLDPGDCHEMKVPLPAEAKKLCLALHEGLHACFWDLDEDAVHESAIDLTRWLWRLGYRLS